MPIRRPRICDRRLGVAFLVLFGGSVLTSLPIWWLHAWPVLTFASLGEHAQHYGLLYIRTLGGTAMLAAGSTALYLGWSGRRGWLHRGFGYAYLVGGGDGRLVGGLASLRRDDLARRLEPPLRQSPRMGDPQLCRHLDVCRMPHRPVRAALSEPGRRGRYGGHMALLDRPDPDLRSGSAMVPGRALDAARDSRLTGWAAASICNGSPTPKSGATTLSALVSDSPSVPPPRQGSSPGWAETRPAGREARDAPRPPVL